MNRVVARATMASVVVFLSVILGLVLTSCGGSSSQTGGSAFVGPPDLFPSATTTPSGSTATAMAVSAPPGATVNLVPLANRLLAGTTPRRQAQNVFTTTTTTTSPTITTTATSTVTSTLTTTLTTTLTPTVTLTESAATTTLTGTTLTTTVTNTVTPTVVTTVTVPGTTATVTNTSTFTLRAQPTVTDTVTTTETAIATVTASPTTVTVGPVTTVTVTGTDTFMTVTDNVTASPATLTTTVTGSPTTTTVNQTSTVVQTPSNAISATFINRSGGQLTQQGVYTAGSRSNTVDVITYASGQSSVVIYVSVGSTLRITPGAVQLAPGASATFSTSGASGAVQYSLFTNQSGGSIDPATGAYTAGTSANTVDLVQARDSAGNVSYATVLVGTALTLRPATSDVAAGGALAFTVTGNVGSPVFTAMVNASGCTVNAASGAYNAGTTGAVSDIVVAGDQAGHLGLATVNVRK